MNFTRAAAVGGGRDDVLSGGWLTARLLLQMFSVGLRRVLRDVLLRLQFGLALRDHIVRLPGNKTVPVRCICKKTDKKAKIVTHSFHLAAVDSRHGRACLSYYILCVR